MRRSFGICTSNQRMLILSIVATELLLFLLGHFVVFIYSAYKVKHWLFHKCIMCYVNTKRSCGAVAACCWIWFSWMYFCVSTAYLRYDDGKWLFIIWKEAGTFRKTGLPHGRKASTEAVTTGSTACEMETRFGKTVTKYSENSLVPTIGEDTLMA